jgi:hypothetical protein
MIAVARTAPIPTETNSGASALAAGTPPDLFPAALQVAVQSARPQERRSSDRPDSGVERQVHEAQADSTAAAIDSTQLPEAMAALAAGLGILVGPGDPGPTRGSAAPELQQPRAIYESYTIHEFYTNQGT